MPAFTQKGYSKFATPKKPHTGASYYGNYAPSNDRWTNNTSSSTSNVVKQHNEYLKRVKQNEQERKIRENQRIKQNEQARKNRENQRMGNMASVNVTVNNIKALVKKNNSLMNKLRRRFTRGA